MPNYNLFMSSPDAGRDSRSGGIEEEERRIGSCTLGLFVHARACRKFRTDAGEWRVATNIGQPI